MKRVQLTFWAEELLADISVYSTLAANAAERGGNDAHDTKDVLDDGNRDVVESIISRLMFESMNLLYPFAKTPVRHDYHENGSEEVEAYVIELDFPYERSETDVQLLKRTIQGYIVYKCLSEWLALTLPETGQWQVWEQKAQEQRERIATVLVLPLRPREVRVKATFY